MVRQALGNYMPLCKKKAAPRVGMSADARGRKTMVDGCFEIKPQ